MWDNPIIPRGKKRDAFAVAVAALEVERSESDASIDGFPVSSTSEQEFVGGQSACSSDEDGDSPKDVFSSRQRLQVSVDEDDLISELLQ